MSAAEYGGLGLNTVGCAIVFEEAGYSLLGPLAMNIFAPDEGNMHLLEVGGDDRTEGPLAAPAGSGRNPFLLLHDRARARRRVGSRPR